MKLDSTAPRRLALDAILAEKLDVHFKGVPQSVLGRPVGEIGHAGLNVLRGDCLLPVAVLKDSAIDNNGAWMRGFLGMTGARIAPHGKTSMAPQLFDRQLRDGAWGLTAATVSQVRIYRRHGASRILYANQLVGDAEIDYILDELRADEDFDFYCLVDSAACLRRLQARLALRPSQQPVQVLLEVGVPNGRTGVRTVEEGLVLGRAIRDAGAGISLRGIEAFEGVFSGYDHARLEVAVAGLLGMMAEVAQAGMDEQWFGSGDVILTAGGSAFFDMAANWLAAADLGRRAVIVLRSGCYLTHDSKHYEHYARRIRERMPQVRALGPGLRPALEIVAQVQSVPEAGRAIAAFGKRDASFDIDLPVPLWWYRPGMHSKPQTLAGQVAVQSLNDQHAFLATGQDADLQVGDVMGFGVSHPCTTFDKWPLLMMVDDDYRVVSAVRTFF